MRSEVRRAVSSLSTALTPQVLRSAGISVLWIHAPFAKRKKSVPGAVDLSIPARSIPVEAMAFESGFASRAQEKAVSAARQGATTTGWLGFNGSPRQLDAEGRGHVLTHSTTSRNCRRQNQWRANAATEH